mmetsp:Transcript_15583/g.35109  ORF Transcript_15583/g.35109 Transcript_15583/m.35109 type:complete len:230 (-) Transcript_15583:37-726(-)
MPSTSRPPAMSIPTPVSTASLAMRTAIGAFFTMLSAMPSAVISASPASTQWFTIPISAAARPLSLAAVRMSSFALPTPTKRGSRCVPPAPGMMPRAVSGRPRMALAPATRISHARASSNPPPSAAPSMTAMVGKGVVAMAWKVPRSLLTKATTSSFDIVMRSFRSAPAQKTFSDVLLMSNVFTVVSADSFLIASLISSTISAQRAFLPCSRSKYRCATPLSPCSTAMVW